VTAHQSGRFSAAAPEGDKAMGIFVGEYDTALQAARARREYMLKEGMEYNGTEYVEPEPEPEAAAGEEEAAAEQESAEPGVNPDEATAPAEAPPLAEAPAPADAVPATEGIDLEIGAGAAAAGSGTGAGNGGAEGAFALPLEEGDTGPESPLLAAPPRQGPLSARSNTNTHREKDFSQISGEPKDGAGTHRSATSGAGTHRSAASGAGTHRSNGSGPDASLMSVDEALREEPLNEGGECYDGGLINDVDWERLVFEHNLPPYVEQGGAVNVFSCCGGGTKPACFEDYAELCTQFGFIALFGAAFPIGAMLAFINNIIEMRLDSQKLVGSTNCLFKSFVYMQRPQANQAEDIGTWYDLLSLMGTIGVVTHCGLVFFTSSYTKHMDFNTRVVLFFGTEHAFILLRLVIDMLIPDIPRDAALISEREIFRKEEPEFFVPMDEGDKILFEREHNKKRCW